MERERLARVAVYVPQAVADELRTAAREEPEPLAVISSCLHSDLRLNDEVAAALDQMVKAAYGSMTSL